MGNGVYPGTDRFEPRTEFKIQNFLNLVFLNFLSQAQICLTQPHFQLLNWSRKYFDADLYPLDADSLRENREEFIKNNRLILNSKQRFWSEKHNVFTEEAKKIALSANNDERIQLIDSIKTYA